MTHSREPKWYSPIFLVFRRRSESEMKGSSHMGRTMSRRKSAWLVRMASIPVLTSMVPTATSVSTLLMFQIYFLKASACVVGEGV